jgi:hypothetical protein
MVYVIQTAFEQQQQQDQDGTAILMMDRETVRNM